MKIKAWLLLAFVLCGLLVTLSIARGIGVAKEGEASEAVGIVTASGMPGRPVPARPIPHHEPGQPSKAANIRREVTQLNAAGVEETVELVGLDAMLADSTISDPFEGNYTFVNLDQIVLARTNNPNPAATPYPGQTAPVEVDTWTAFEPPDVITSPAVISGSLATLGTGMADMAPSIATGDLNGDGRSEQIVGWIGDDRNIRLSIGELPGMLGKLTSDPAAVAHDDGQMDLLVRGYDDALWHRHYGTNVWEEWNNAAGGYLLSGPALASHGDGQFYVFAAGVYSGTGVVNTEATSSIYWRHWNGTVWSDDWDLVDVDPADGVALQDDPAAVAYGMNEIDLFRRGSDNTLRWLHHDGAAWGSWQNLGGILTSGPAAISLGSNQLQVFAQFFDGRLWQREYDGSTWSQWQPLGDLVISSAPAAASPGSNRIDVYARGEDNALWWNRFDGAAWSGWESLGGLLGSGVGVAVHNNGYIELFSQTADDPGTEQVEPDGSLQQNNYDGAAWTGWADCGGLKACCWTYDIGVQGDIVTVETGHFTGDDREQIVIAYEITQTVSVKLYDVNDGFMPELLASYSTPQLSEYLNSWIPNVDVATGDLDALESVDGRDEISFSLLLVGGTSYAYSYVSVLDVEYDAGQGDWQIDVIDESSESFGWMSSIVDSAITSGDFNGDGDDDLATSWVGNGGGSSYLCTLGIYDYDYGQNTIERTYIEDRGGQHEHFGLPYIDLAAANLDLDEEGTYEIIYSGPFDENYKSELAIYSADPLTNTQKLDAYDLTPSEESRKLAVGDFNRDLKPEIALLMVSPAGAQPLIMYIFGHHDGQWLTLHDTQIISPWSIPWADAGLFSMAAGDLTGESLRVGPPTYRLDRGIETIVAVLNGPPFHRDTLDGVEHSIAVGTASAAYESESSETTNIKNTFTHNWSLGHGAGFGIGESEGTHVSLSITNSFGGHFEKTAGTLTSLIETKTIQTADSDLLITAATNYKVWEYPLYEDDDAIPDSHIAVVFPLEDVQNWHIEDGLQCNTWYKPTHQLGNVWSYPAIGNPEQFNGYEPDDAESHLAVGSHTAGGSTYEWSLETATLETEQLSGGASYGLMVDFEAQAGGDEVEVKPFGFGTKSRGPYMKASLSANYDFEYLGESQTEIGNSTTVRNGYGPVPAEDIFAVDSHLFWARFGYLVLDHTTEPQPQLFWNRYNKPDPTFLRPWAGGHCDVWIGNILIEDKSDFSQDIEIRPIYAIPGETVTISATVRNYSNVYAYYVRVRFYRGDPDEGGRQIGADQVIPTLARNLGPETVSIEWTAEGRGMQRIYAVVDPDNELAEMHDEVTNVNNNKGYNLIQIGAAGFIDPALFAEGAYYVLPYGRQSHLLNLASGEQDQSLVPAFDAHIPLVGLDEVLPFEFVSLESPPLSPLGKAVIGEVLALIAYEDGQKRENFELKPTPEDAPGVITVQYSPADLRGTAEEDLRLYTWTPTGWTEPACAGHSLLHLPEEDLFVAPICQTGTFALFGDDYEVRLPFVNK